MNQLDITPLIKDIIEMSEEIKAEGKYPKSSMAFSNAINSIKKMDFKQAYEDLDECYKELPFGSHQEIQSLQSFLMAIAFRMALKYRQIIPGIFAFETAPLTNVQIRFQKLSKLSDGTVDVKFEVVRGYEAAAAHAGFLELAVQDIVEKVIAYNEKKKAEKEESPQADKEEAVVQATPKIIL